MSGEDYDILLDKIGRLLAIGTGVYLFLSGFYGIFGTSGLLVLSGVSLVVFSLFIIPIFEEEAGEDG